MGLEMGRNGREYKDGAREIYSGSFASVGHLGFPLLRRKKELFHYDLK